MPTSIHPLILATAILAGCASAPTWEGMSENEIAAWRSMNIEAAEAQAYREAGLDTAEIEAWREAGLPGREAILAWNDEGWTAATAEPWLKTQFDLETATDWAEKKFTADQARAWVDAGFSLKEAINNRAKGLAPVR